MSACRECGREVKAREYHPWMACYLAMAGMSDATIRANLKAAVQYGARAERAGVAVGRAMKDITAVPADG